MGIGGGMVTLHHRDPFEVKCNTKSRTHNRETPNPDLSRTVAVSHAIRFLNLIRCYTATLLNTGIGVAVSV